jgi:senataxin
MASSESDVHSLLATLRDSPIDNSGASDKVLGTVYNYLMAVPVKPPDNVVHWFCRQAAPDTVAAATFLIRLFAYNSQLVENWKTILHSCLSRCSHCVQGIEQVKVSSRNTCVSSDIHISHSLLISL